MFALSPFENAFIAADHLVEEARRETPVIIIDFHAEATSEKVALAQYLDGRVTAVLGTHTHVQTNDARVLARGTAAITDAGMTGPHDSVIGSVAEGAIKRFVTGMPVGSSPQHAGCGSRARWSSAGRTAARRAASPSASTRNEPYLKTQGTTTCSRPESTSTRPATEPFG